MCGDDAIRPRTIYDHDLLPPKPTELFCDDAADDVRAAAGRGLGNDLDRPFRVGRGRGDCTPGKDSGEGGKDFQRGDAARFAVKGRKIRERVRHRGAPSLATDRLIIAPDRLGKLFYVSKYT
jgi:hypothetical protein